MNVPDSAPVTGTRAAVPDDPAAPWLAITRRYVQPGMNHDLAAMRDAIAAGWGAQAAGKLRADGQ